jgi:xylose dehydrogenase (NAD/NADP)
MPNRDVRWGFIGAGNIARTALAPAVHSATGARLGAVAARDPERARQLGPSGAVYDDYAGILDDPLVDAVYISLANDQHAPWTIRALQSGKHVLCEKPLGLNSDEVRSMRSAADAADRLLVEATWNRWHPRTRRAHSLVRSGLVGTVTEVTTGFVVSGPKPGNYRMMPNGGGALYDLGCYSIVAAMWATGGSTAVVESANARLTMDGVDLETQARVRLGETTVLIECAMDRAPAQWLSITGTEGSIDFPDSFVMSRNSESSLTIVDHKGPRIEYFPPVDPYTLMVEHVSAAIRDEACYLPPATQSIEMIGILEAIASAATTI